MFSAAARGVPSFGDQAWKRPVSVNADPFNAIPAATLSPAAGRTPLQTLTANGNGSINAATAFSPYGSLVVGARLLIALDANTDKQGIWTVTVVGDGTHPWKLTRALDNDTAAENPDGAMVLASNAVWNGVLISPVTQWYYDAVDDDWTIAPSAVIGAAGVNSGTFEVLNDLLVDRDASITRNLHVTGAFTVTGITRAVMLPPKAAGLDSATLVQKGTTPDLVDTIAYADAVTQGAYWTFYVPNDWASGNLFVQPIWGPGSTDAAAHAVRWKTGIRRMTNGINTYLSAGTTNTWTGVSGAKTANVVVGETVTDTGVAPTAAGQLHRIYLQRIGGDGADTYVGIVNLLGLVISYTALY